MIGNAIVDLPEAEPFVPDLKPWLWACHQSQTRQAGQLSSGFQTITETAYQACGSLLSACQIRDSVSNEHSACPLKLPSAKLSLIYTLLQTGTPPQVGP